MSILDDYLKDVSDQFLDTQEFVKVTVPCMTCKREFSITLPSQGLRDYKFGKLMQQCFPNLDGNMRELLITGICGECFDLMSEQMDD